MTGAPSARQRGVLRRRALRAHGGALSPAAVAFVVTCAGACNELSGVGDFDFRMPCAVEACPAPEDPCQVAACSEADECTTLLRPLGSPCGDLSVCDAAGACVERGTPLWVRRFGGPGTEAPSAIAVDAMGDIVVGGLFTNTIDFGDGPVSAAGDAGAFVVKLDAMGEPKWVTYFDGTGHDEVTAVALRPDGTILAGGIFSGTTDFGDGLVTSAGEYDVFVVALDPDGVPLWSANYGDAAYQFLSCITADPLGDVFLGGYFAGSINLGGGALASNGGSDVFLAKLDALGKFLWSKRAGDTEEQRVLRCTADSAGNIIAAGDFAGSLGFGGGAMVSMGQSDAFLVKLDADGKFGWNYRFGDAEEQRALALAIATGERPVVAGRFAGSLDLGTGQLTSSGIADIFVGKYYDGSTPIWAERFGGTFEQVPNGLAVDPFDDVVMTGFFSGEVGFGAKTLATAGTYDAFVTKLNADGLPIWSHALGGTGVDVGVSVATDAAGDTFVTGTFSATVSFGSTTLTSEGNQDIFIAKLSP